MINRPEVGNAADPSPPMPAHGKVLGARGTHAIPLERFAVVAAPIWTLGASHPLAIAEVRRIVRSPAEDVPE
jgi:hypothetical protein